jgi:putative ABC transport system permease protein
MAGALVLVRSLATVLFEMRPHDPGVFAAAAGVLLAMAVMACIVPALRAVRIDPISILRAE